MAKKKESAKVVTSKSIIKEPVFNDKGLQEVELLKDHGHNKKGDKLFKHPNTAAMLIERGIAK